jgi:UDP-N-acetylmuramyl pentapeptide phosphotransferase/UDP-N-acetylglucosamine-1-phosphate transferase
LAGWSEPQVVVRFWLMAAAFAALALATIKLR